MTKARVKHRITAAQRGQMIQRILVDGWSVAETAVSAGVDARLITRWVAEYRRRGMASLHPNDGRLARLRRGVSHSYRTLCQALLAPLRRSERNSGSPAVHGADELAGKRALRFDS